MGGRQTPDDATRARMAAVAAIPLQPAVGELEPADDAHAELIAAAVNAGVRAGTLASRGAPAEEHWDALSERLAGLLDETQVADVLAAVAAWLDEVSP